MREINHRLLEEIAEGKTRRSYSASEIAGIKGENARLDGLIEAYDATKAHEETPDA